MSCVLTLVAARDATTLAAPAIARMREAIRGEAPVILSPGEAADIPCAAMPDPDALRPLLDGAAIDVFAIPAEGRRKKLLIADMDSTIVTSETLDEIAAHAGLKEQIAGITRRSMNGELDFAEALRTRVAMLKGLTRDALQATWEHTELTEGARALVATMNAHGAHTALVSGGFTYFTARVAERCGFTTHHANRLLDDGTVLTGEVGEPILDRDAKLATLRALAAEHGLDITETLAVGDGANDLAMISAAGPRHRLPRQADRRGDRRGTGSSTARCARCCSRRAIGRTNSRPESQTRIGIST